MDSQSVSPVSPVASTNGVEQVHVFNEFGESSSVMQIVSAPITTGDVSIHSSSPPLPGCLGQMPVPVGAGSQQPPQDTNGGGSSPPNGISGGGTSPPTPGRGSSPPDSISPQESGLSPSQVNVTSVERDETRLQTASTLTLPPLPFANPNIPPAAEQLPLTLSRSANSEPQVSQLQLSSQFPLQSFDQFLAEFSNFASPTEDAISQQVSLQISQIPQWKKPEGTQLISQSPQIVSNFPMENTQENPTPGGVLRLSTFRTQIATVENLFKGIFTSQRTGPPRIEEGIEPTLRVHDPEPKRSYAPPSLIAPGPTGGGGRDEVPPEDPRFPGMVAAVFCCCPAQPAMSQTLRLIPRLLSF